MQYPPLPCTPLPPPAGWVDCVQRSYTADGAAVFFRGLGTTLCRAFLVNGAIFSAYELSHKLLTG